MDSCTRYLSLFLLCVLMQITHQRTASISTETIVGATSVVSSPSSSESVTSVQASISASSTQAPVITTTTIYPAITAISYSKPVIVQGLKDVTVREGLKLEMKCKATGFPTPYFIWRKGNKQLKNTSRILITQDNSLIVLNTSRHDAGEYKCIARNSVGLESASIALVKVNYISDVNITIDKTGSVQEGTNVKLTCSAHSHPRVLFTWTRNGERVDGFMIQITVRNGLYVGILHRREIGREMGGNYTCLAQSRDEGLLVTASKLLHVHLASKPTYPPSEEMETTAHTIALPIHEIKYLGNGKKVRRIQVIVQQLNDDTLPKRRPLSYNHEELGPYKASAMSPYIAAVLDMEEDKKSFVLGDDHVYSNANRDRKVYRNVPLRPEMYYTAFQRMVSDDNDCESLDWIQPTKTRHLPKHDTKTSTTDLSLILGITFGIVLLIGVAGATFVVVRKFIGKKPTNTAGTNSTDALEMYTERELMETPERPRRKPVEV